MSGRTRDLARDFDVGGLELSSGRRSSSSGRMNDDLAPGGGAHEVGRDEPRGSQLDPVGQRAPAPGPHDRPHLPPGVMEVSHNVPADEPVGSGHGDPPAHEACNALPVPGAAARLAR